MEQGTGGNNLVGGVGGDALFTLMGGLDVAVKVGSQQGGVSLGCVCYLSHPIC